MEKRIVVATVLSTLVILAWWMWVTPPAKMLPPQTQAQSGTKPADQPCVLSGNDASQMPAVGVPGKGNQKAVKVTDTVLKFNSFEVVFNSLGAKIKNWYVKEKGNCLTDLVYYPADNSFVPDNFATFNNLNFNVITQTQDSIIFSAVTDNVRIIKTYELSETGLHKLEFQLTNLSNKEKVFPLNIPWGPGIGSTPSDQKSEVAFTRLIGLAKITDKSSKIVKLKADSHNTRAYNWIGIDNRYFLMSVLSNESFSKALVNIDKTAIGKLPKTDFVSTVKIPAGKSVSIGLSFYLGPKVYSELKKTGHGLDQSVDFGFFSSLGKGAFYSLHYFYDITKNYGVAIIILTLIMQIVLFPLTMKSYQASKAMRILQPKMKEMQTKFKGDPKRLNVEMLNLYKSHKVNPLSGCLPMLLQLPIFWALYQTLSNTYELRKAPFIFWMTDLSAPDLLFTVSGVPIRVLPLLMGGAMFFQQKASGTTMDPSQKSLMYMMLIIFTVIFWNFASGLVLYWLINSILTLAGQYIVMRPKEA